MQNKVLHKLNEQLKNRFKKRKRGLITGLRDSAGKDRKRGGLGEKEIHLAPREAHRQRLGREKQTLSETDRQT